MRIGSAVAIGVFVVGLGLVVTDVLVNGFGFEPIRYLLLYLLMAGCIDLLDQGLRSGWLIVPHGRLSRATQPVAYWSFAVLYLVLFPAVILGAMGMQAETLF
ncbi:hypothetical protein GCM10017083_06720 [Thalassobaculum fulvum]|uniref:Uncharacterized protein n=1 Tax=Thalassobaculum fulvum TaxID=1633335 RepID=A0A918XNH6_9PROT|nr:hypothetical protein [Thalassobaculum fulvum]GHD42112.1 hypothetical protein GCM10017083_06720 [Thalassobaculum fulvum]